MKVNKELEKSVLIGDLASVISIIKNLDSLVVDAKDKYGRTVLFDAITKGFDEIVSVLCLSGVNVNSQDSNGKSPLHFASIHNRFEIAKMLIHYGADVNLKDENGNTPIFDAIFNSNGNPEIIRLLKDNNADFIKVNNYGVSPKELANTIGNFDVSYIFY